MCTLRDGMLMHVNGLAVQTQLYMLNSVGMVLKIRIISISRMHAAGDFIVVYHI